jgi:hypothetical protein
MPLDASSLAILYVVLRRSRAGALHGSVLGLPLPKIRVLEFYILPYPSRFRDMQFFAGFPLPRDTATSVLVSGSKQSKCLCTFVFSKMPTPGFWCAASRTARYRSFVLPGIVPAPSIFWIPIRNIQYRLSIVRTRSTIRAAGFVAVLQFLFCGYTFISPLPRPLHCPDSLPYYYLSCFYTMDALLAKRAALRARCLNPPARPSS